MKHRWYLIATRLHSASGVTDVPQGRETLAVGDLGVEYAEYVYVSQPLFCKSKITLKQKGC